jgi:hypothetical protein
MNDIYERYLESCFIRINIPSREAFEYMVECYLDWYDPYLPKNKDAKIPSRLFKQSFVQYRSV